jgi:hypothetical protein
MFCPQCKVEYRQGFTRCADCDVELVELLPVASETGEEQTRLGLGSPDAPPERVWSGEDQESCVAVCRSLVAADIPYRVLEQNRQEFWNRKQYFEIWVSTSDVQRAKEIANEGVVDFDDSEEDQAIMELRARDDLPVEEVHGDWNPKNWYPEDATLEVWSGNPKERGSVVEMSLKENRINYRVAMESDELKRVFVMPDDETRAREIVREIVEGAPPESN